MGQAYTRHVPAELRITYPTQLMKEPGAAWQLLKAARITETIACTLTSTWCAKHRESTRVACWRPGIKFAISFSAYIMAIYIGEGMVDWRKNGPSSSLHQLTNTVSQISLSVNWETNINNKHPEEQTQTSTTSNLRSRSMNHFLYPEGDLGHI